MADAGNFMTIKPMLLIEEVKKQPILWNPKHPFAASTKRKMKQAWKEISGALNIPEDVVRNKWKNIRDCYVKHLRNEKFPNKKFTPYQWAENMEFMRPMLQRSSSRLMMTVRSVSDRLPDTSDEDEKLTHKPCRNPPTTTATATAATGSSITTSFTALELYFLGHAKTVSQLPLERQFEVKKQISDIILGEEYRQLEVGGQVGGQLDGDPLVAKVEMVEADETSCSVPVYYDDDKQYFDDDT